jgi:hypothetical protein
MTLDSMISSTRSIDMATDAPLSAQIPIRGEDGSWVYKGSGSSKGKQVCLLAHQVIWVWHTNRIEVAARGGSVVEPLSSTQPVSCRHD